MATKRAGLCCREPQRKFWNVESASLGRPEAPGTSKGNPIEAFLELSGHAGLTLPALSEGCLHLFMVFANVHHLKFLYFVLLRIVLPYTQFYGFFPSLTTEGV